MSESIEEQLEPHFDVDVIHSNVGELKKILNINKSSTLARNYIIVNKNYTDQQKITLMNMLEACYLMKSKKIKTSQYDYKPYVQLFFDEFLEYIKINNLTTNELKVCLALYSILNSSNTFGNVVLSLSQKDLVEKTGVGKANVCRSIKSLIDKKILKKENSSLYINYSFFYRGDKVSYDSYKDQFNLI